MTPVPVSYLIIGTTFLIIGTAGIWGINAALWAVPVLLVGFGIWGLMVAAKKSREKDARLPS